MVVSTILPIFAPMKNTKWCENVILVDADYIDKVAFDLIVNFERMIGRRIPQADTARWIECIALDGGIRPERQEEFALQRHTLKERTPHSAKQRRGKKQENRSASTQVVLLHGKGQMENFNPGAFAELDGKAFQSELGEMQISCVPVEELTTMSDLFIDSLQVISNAAEVKRLMVVPDAETIYNKVREALRHANPDQHITVFAMQPLEGGQFRQEILGYSLMAALGIKSAELTEAR